MTTQVTSLVHNIKARLEEMAKSEGETVRHAIELARLFTELKQQVGRRNWERTLQELGISPRVACRYLAIGNSWWLDQPLGPEVLALLPCDLQKLESLSRLSPPFLEVVIKAIDCKEASRGAVISAVHKVLGDEPAAPKGREITVEKLKNQWEGYVRRMVDVIEDIQDEDFDEETRQLVWNELQAKFAEVEELLYPQEEAGEPLAGEDEEASSEADFDEEQSE
jgi:hypothetical protein